MAHDWKLKDCATSANTYVATSLRRTLHVICLTLFLFPSALPAETIDSRAYRLAPGDRITVTVFGQPDLSADVVIDDAGTVALPLLDPIQVKDLTLVECQTKISDRLAAGVLRKPSVNVRIAELRPLSVLGDVRLPGSYPFRFGSTVQTAVALAGGFGPDEALRQTAVSEFLLAEERVRQLTLQQRTLLVRKARLEAELDGKDTFSPPASAGAAGDDDSDDSKKIVQEEKNILLAHRTILQGQIEVLRSQQPHLQEQIDANTEQSNVGKKQLDLIREQIERYDKLFKQGLGTQNNEFQYRVLETNQEATIWRLMSDISRLQEQSVDLQFKMKEVEAVFKRDVTKELQETRDHLNELEVTLPAATRMRDVRRQYAGGAAELGANHSIRVTRMHDGRVDILNADDTTPVEPGDVIDVRDDMLHALPHDGRSASHSTSHPSETQARQAAETRISR